MLFLTAGKAHHHAFAATNGDDPEWSDWYGKHLAPTLSDFLGTAIDPEALAADLKRVDAEMRASAPSADWTFYYADWFLAGRS